jgi:hypothetical protein
MLSIMKTKNNEAYISKLNFRHSGLDPESRKCLISLDTGFRRYDNGDGFVRLCKAFKIVLPYMKGEERG